MDLQEFDRRTRRAVVIAITANVLLVLVKGTTGFVGHSHALVADGVESVADVFSSLVAYGALRLASRPRDESHPYGHGKAEPLLAIGLAGGLILAALGIAIESLREILAPNQMPAVYTLPILAAIILVKVVLSRYTQRVALATGSTAVGGDAAHHRADILVSGLAFSGIAIGLLTGRAQIDAWAALLAVPIIVITAVRQVRAPVAELLDAAQPAMEAHVRAVASGVTGVTGLDKCLVRKAGREFYVDLHIEVDPDLSVRVGHDIAHRVQATVRMSNPQIVDVLVHVEPADRSEGRTERP